MAYVYNNGSVMSASNEVNMKMLCLVYPRQFAKFVGRVCICTVSL